MPSVKRTVFNMYCIDGFSHKDIATAIGITEKGSASILAKARAQLKSAVNDYLKRTGR
ncbi:MAG: RNA polymerase sigma factor [Bacteroidaceae bacterium]